MSKYKNPIVVIAFKKYHFGRWRFQKQMEKRFRTAFITIDAAMKLINEQRYYNNYVLLITDVPNLPNVTPNDRIVLKGKQIITETENIDLPYNTRLLTDRVFHEILSWLLENRFPHEMNLM